MRVHQPQRGQRGHDVEAGVEDGDASRGVAHGGADVQLVVARFGLRRERQVEQEAAADWHQGHPGDGDGAAVGARQAHAGERERPPRRGAVELDGDLVDRPRRPAGL